MPDTLLALVSSYDPFTRGLVGDDDLTGPVITLAQEHRFGRILLFSTDELNGRGIETAQALQDRVPGCEIVHVPVGLPADAGLDKLSERIRMHVTELVGEPAGLFAVPHPCWDMLAIQSIQCEAPMYAGNAPSIAASMNGAGSRPGRVRESRTRYGEPRVPTLEPEPAADLDRVSRRLGICGEHPNMRVVLQSSAALAEHDVPVLIEGETGTGKSLIARLVHEMSGRARGTFVQVNCGALPEKLVESTLFGHRKGAFTGATDDHVGKFEAADGGTLFLDEVGELPIELQPKLLKVLEDGIVEPIGATKGFSVDVRVVAATNRDLKAMVAERAFREDLYYRLSFGLIRIPPLRERRSDIRHLALHALARINKSLRVPRRLSPEAIARLEQQEWRGNVRDLENVIGRSVLLARTEELRADDLLIEDPVRAGDPYSGLPTPSEAFSLDEFLASARKQLILRALDIAAGSQSGAARLLGLSPQAVHKFLKGSSP